MITHPQLKIFFFKVLPSAVKQSEKFNTAFSNILVLFNQGQDH